MGIQKNRSGIYNIMRIVLKGKPISNNQLYKRGRGNSFYMTSNAKALKENYQWQAKTQYRGKPLIGDLTVEITLFFPNKIRRDWDNYGKLVNDAFNGIVWKDDSQVQVGTVRKDYDPKDPRIEVEVIWL